VLDYHTTNGVTVSVMDKGSRFVSIAASNGFPLLERVSDENCVTKLDSVAFDDQMTVSIELEIPEGAKPGKLCTVVTKDGDTMTVHIPKKSYPGEECRLRVSKAEFFRAQIAQQQFMKSSRSSRAIPQESVKVHRRRSSAQTGL